MAAAQEPSGERQENKMSNTNLPAKKDNSRLIRQIIVGPVGNWLYELLTKTDYDRQVEAIYKLRRQGMEHGRVKMSSTRGGKIHTEKGDIIYRQQHDIDCNW